MSDENLAFTMVPRRPFFSCACEGEHTCGGPELMEAMSPESVLRSVHQTD